MATKGSKTKTGTRRGRVKIPEKTKMVLWARAAGRCQYSGCNCLLIGDLVSGNYEMNASYIAHIIADAPEGPRGDIILSPKLATEVSNLMLMCDKHHRLIDREDIAGHSVALLQGMKAVHEARIEIVGSIDEDKSCHVLRYAARIGANESPVSFDTIKLGMLPDRYPAEGSKTIDLEIAGLALADNDSKYWDIQLTNLRAQFAEKVRGRFERGEIKRLAIFALAPIPLLIELGRLTSDISDAEVWQLLREPKGWKWQDQDSPIQLQTSNNGLSSESVALKLEISAPISDDRIISAVGEKAAIWSVASTNQHNDIIRRRDDLRDFRRILRKTLEDIKAQHGEDARIHLFPATPVSASIEVGRVWMPKAHLPITIYDQNRVNGGFHKVSVLEQLSHSGVSK